MSTPAGSRCRAAARTEPGSRPEAEHVATFTDEMNHADADWQLIVYGRAMHGFTHKHAAPGVIPGVACEPIADARSFTATGTFLAGVLPQI